jgi:hypothetical protein
MDALACHPFAVRIRIELSLQGGEKPGNYAGVRLIAALRDAEIASNQGASGILLHRIEEDPVGSLQVILDLGASVGVYRQAMPFVSVEERKIPVGGMTL